MISKLTIFSILLALSQSVFGANHCVRPSADVTNDGDGTTWAAAASPGGAGARKGMPATLTRDDTYYVADGNYAGYTFDDAVSGTTLITIKKATIADHGTSTGWDNTYGDGQAVWDTELVWTRSYYVFDGNGTHTIPSNNTADYGFKVDADELEKTDGLLEIGTSGNTVSDITIRYVHVENTQDGSVNCGTVCVRFFPGGAVQQRVKLQNCYFQRSGKDGIQISHSDFILVERCYIERLGKLESGDPDVHGQTVQLFYGGDDIIFRWNVWESNEGQSLLAIAGIDEPTERVRFYGNVIFNPLGATSAASGGFNTSGGIIGNAWSGPTYFGHDGLYVYNNTVVNVGGTYGGHAHFPMTTPGSEGLNEYGYNNLFYNCGGNVGASAWTEWDYHASGASSSYGGANEQTGLASTIFVDYDNDDYRLASATDAPKVLTGETWWDTSDTFFEFLDSDLDMYGNTYDSRGAFAVAESPPPVGDGPTGFAQPGFRGIRGFR